MSFLGFVLCAVSKKTSRIRCFIFMIQYDSIHMPYACQGGDEILVLREKKDDQETPLWSVSLLAFHTARLIALPHSKEVWGAGRCFVWLPR